MVLCSICCWMSRYWLWASWVLHRDACHSKVVLLQVNRVLRVFNQYFSLRCIFWFGLFDTDTDGLVPVAHHKALILDVLLASEHRTLGSSSDLFNLLCNWLCLVIYADVIPVQKTNCLNHDYGMGKEGHLISSFVRLYSITYREFVILKVLNL